MKSLLPPCKSSPALARDGDPRWDLAADVKRKLRTEQRNSAYQENTGRLPVGWADDSATQFEAAFAAARESLYGFALDAQVELVTLRLRTQATVRMPPRLRGEAHPAGAILLTMRIARTELSKLKSVHGPVLIALIGASCLVRTAL